MYKQLKRCFDVGIAFVGLIVTAPLLLLVAIAIRLDSPGPIIFEQTRLGENGKSFRMLKFRSMTVGAEAGGVYESVGDPRVTNVGRIIRKTSIDELPQFINILRGEMSLIGPRPTLLYHPWTLEEYTGEQRKRFSVKPGISGLAQTQGRKNLSWEQRLKYDVEYAENLSLLLDIKIIFKTVVQVLSNADNVNLAKTVNISGKDEELKEDK